MQCLASPYPLWHATPAVDCGGTAPDIQLDLAPAEAKAHAWELLPWTIIREHAGPGWHWSLAAALPAGDAALQLCTQRQDDEMTVLFGRDAARIVVRWRTCNQDNEQFWRGLSGWMLGTVLGYAMCLRGLPTLHGSVVEIGGQAVGLLGASGAGKSTLTGALVAAGHTMLADDHLVVRRLEAGQGKGRWYALPGPPRLRMWPTSMRVFDGLAQPMSAWTDNDGKRHIEPTANAYCAEPQPLAALYILMPREPARREAALEKLAPAAALNALMKQRFCQASLGVTHTAASLAALAELVQQTPVRLLYRPEGLETLDSVVAVVEGSLSNHGR